MAPCYNYRLVSRGSIRHVVPVVVESLLTSAVCVQVALLIKSINENIQIISNRQGEYTPDWDSYQLTYSRHTGLLTARNLQ